MSSRSHAAAKPQAPPNVPNPARPSSRRGGVVAAAAAGSDAPGGSPTKGKGRSAKAEAAAAEAAPGPGRRTRRTGASGAAPLLSGRAEVASGRESPAEEDMAAAADLVAAPAKKKARRSGGKASGATKAVSAAAVESGPGLLPSILADFDDSDWEDGEGGEGRHEHVMDTIIKVFATHTEPNFSLPWQMRRSMVSSSSGFVIEGRMLLTNAHCVDYATLVKVKRRGSDKKHVARVLAVGAECDVALLTVDGPGSDEFWEGLPSVSFGPLPRLQDGVTVIGFPIGGDTLSVTQGVVSRIEVTPYAHGGTELLGIQVDAAVNSGNSGGPAFNSAGLCVGIAFQSLKDDEAEGISYVIPTPVVDHFLRDYRSNGKYTGFPTLGCEWQRTENRDLRAFLGYPDPDVSRGVLIRRVEPTSAAHGILKPGDVLLAFDGIQIASDGTVPFRSGERISFSYLVSQKFIGDQARLRVLAEGKEEDRVVKLGLPGKLVPFHLDGKQPPYYIIAGLVFTTASVPYMRSEFGKEFEYDAPLKLLDRLTHGHTDKEGQEVVILSQVLAADVNLGWDDGTIHNIQVVSVNGEKIDNLKHLVQLVESSTDQFLRFDLEYSQLVVLDRKAALASTADILASHLIPSDRFLLD